MTNILLITFLASIIYLGVANRLSNYIQILALQGIILFGVAFIELHQINTINLILVLFETIIFKTIAIPLFLKYIIKKNEIVREAEPYVSAFTSIIIITAIILCSFVLSNIISGVNLRKIFLITSLSALFSGLYIIISRKKIITHIMGYMIIENGVFVLSLDAGNKMTGLVNIGITLDIFVSVLVLGIFVNKIRNTFEEMNVDNLTNLKD
jgi:hydrogenase-4 component E